MATKNPWVLALGLVCGVLVVGSRTAWAAYPVASAPVHGRALVVDDDDEGDGDWFPLWFGFRAFAPRRRVIIERNYYPPPPPPRPAYYYYCRDPEGYYPRIPNCPSGWLRVLPPGDGPP